VLNQTLDVDWKGIISFASASSVPSYDQDEPPILQVPAPLDINLLQARPVDVAPAPTPRYAINFLIEFMPNAADVNRAYINGESYEPDAANSATGAVSQTYQTILFYCVHSGNTSLLFSYLFPGSFPSPEVKARYYYDDNLKLNFSLGD